jgi:hypothetical protein
MPFAVKSVLDTTLPGQTARQVWHGADLRSHALLVLTYSRLYVLPAGRAVTPGVLQAVKGQGDPDAVLGPAATVIELAALRRVVADLAADTVHLEAVGTGSGVKRVSLVFASAEVADAVFTGLWKKAGDGFHLTPFKLEGWAAAQAPVLAMIGVGLAMLGLGIGLSGLEEYAVGRAEFPDKPVSAVSKALLDPLARLLGGLNWKWVCGFGGGVLAVLQVWLYRRLTAPPARLELVRK